MQMQQMQEFVSELQPIILKLSAELNFTVVLDRTRSNVFYADPATDITDVVVEELKKQSMGMPLEPAADSIPGNPNRP